MCIFIYFLNSRSHPNPGHPISVPPTCPCNPHSTSLYLLPFAWHQTGAVVPTLFPAATRKGTRVSAVKSARPSTRLVDFPFPFFFLFYILYVLAARALFFRSRNESSGCDRVLPLLSLARRTEFLRAASSLLFVSITAALTR